MQKEQKEKIDFEQFKEILLEKRRSLMQNMEDMEETALRRSRGDAAGDLTNIPTHMADISADTFEQHLTLGLIENESEVIREINEALERLENGTFGECEECGKQVSLKRLKHIPYARLCISCKKEEENNNQSYWRYY